MTNNNSLVEKTGKETTHESSHDGVDVLFGQTVSDKICMVRLQCVAAFLPTEVWNVCRACPHHSGCCRCLSVEVEMEVETASAIAMVLHKQIGKGPGPKSDIDKAVAAIS